MEFEVGEKLGHGEVLQARGVVRHGVGIPSYVGGFLGVTVVPSVQA